ncbi:hypothetical protein NDU88_002842 [Pleurodeles waltl]|uniref:Uncharacterized protein n=1 Tax=Pleurodeles waltl TaxID=8319 RepID=A0AAV7NHN2_PLEWA|nr:hypothetical protein NDU88_002842 [Pleurodeles waltl]
MDPPAPWTKRRIRRRHMALRLHLLRQQRQRSLPRRRRLCRRQRRLVKVSSRTERHKRRRLYGARTPRLNARGPEPAPGWTLVRLDVPEKPDEFEAPQPRRLTAPGTSAESQAVGTPSDSLPKTYGIKSTETSTPTDSWTDAKSQGDAASYESTSLPLPLLLRLGSK